MSISKIIMVQSVSSSDFKSQNQNRIHSTSQIHNNSRSGSLISTIFSDNVDNNNNGSIFNHTNHPRPRNNIQSFNSSTRISFRSQSCKPKRVRQRRQERRKFQQPFVLKDWALWLCDCIINLWMFSILVQFFNFISQRLPWINVNMELRQTGLRPNKTLLPSFTLEEIQKHDNINDLWLIMFDKVYDFTKFLNHHPGGNQVLLDCGGVDATEAFNDVGHSQMAIYMMEPYLIGSLKQKDVERNKERKQIVVLKEREKILQLRPSRGRFQKRPRTRSRRNRLKSGWTVIKSFLTAKLSSTVYLLLVALISATAILIIETKKHNLDNNY